jgi:hypothetical protein
MHRLVLCLVFAASTLSTPRRATAAVTDVYDTVDSVELTQSQFVAGSRVSTLVLRGILTGENAPVVRTYRFIQSGEGVDGLAAAMHCQRLAVLAMSKPGKFQFAIHAPNINTSAGGCRLSLVAP